MLETTYPIVTNFDINVGNAIKSIDIDQQVLNTLAAQMGINDAIDRRLALNPDLPKEVNINIHNVLISNEANASGTFNPARLASLREPGTMPASDLDIYLRNIAGSAAFQIQAQEHPRHHFDHLAEDEFDNTLRHELVHFADPMFDDQYERGLSADEILARHRAAMEAELLISRELPEVKALYDATKQHSRRYQVVGALATGLAAEVLASYLGLDRLEAVGIEYATVLSSFAYIVKKRKSSLAQHQATLTMARNAQYYTYLPCETRARDMAQKYKDVGKISTINFRPSPFAL